MILRFALLTVHTLSFFACLKILLPAFQSAVHTFFYGCG
jgi:hypothetical protein